MNVPISIFLTSSFALQLRNHDLTLPTHWGGSPEVPESPKEGNNHTMLSFPSKLQPFILESESVITIIVCVWEREEQKVSTCLYVCSSVLGRAHKCAWVYSHLCRCTWICRGVCVARSALNHRCFSLRSHPPWFWGWGPLTRTQQLPIRLHNFPKGQFSSNHFLDKAFQWTTSQSVSPQEVTSVSWHWSTQLWSWELGHRKCKLSPGEKIGTRPFKFWMPL